MILYRLELLEVGSRLSFFLRKFSHTAAWGYSQAADLLFCLSNLLISMSLILFMRLFYYIQ